MAWQHMQHAEALDQTGGLPCAKAFTCLAYRLFEGNSTSQSQHELDDLDGEDLHTGWRSLASQPQDSDQYLCSVAHGPHLFGKSGRASCICFVQLDLTTYQEAFTGRDDPPMAMLAEGRPCRF